MNFPEHPTLQQASLFAQSAVLEAREIALRYFRKKLTVESKIDDSPVTIADREVEAYLRNRIASTYPSHGMFGEEQGKQAIESEYVWVIDPIDGTRSFISGSPLWGTLIALLYQNQPILGIVDMPFLNECWVGVHGQKTRQDSALCCTNGIRHLKDAVVYTTSPDVFAGTEQKVFETVTNQAKGRRFGGDCYNYALIASGHVDVVVEASLQPYDYLSLVPVIQGAGGVVTDWHGRPLGLHSDGKIVAAATRELHAEIIAITSK